MATIQKQLILYLLVGLASAGVDLGTLMVLLWLQQPVWLATTTGFLVGLIFNYVCQSRLTFAAKLSAKSATRYVIIVLLNYVLTMGVIYLALGLQLAVIVGKVFALALVAVVGFIASRLWIYR